MTEYQETLTCSCGKAKVAVKKRPFARFTCHCTICQSLYKKPYADVTALWSGDVEVLTEDQIEYKKYRLPPAVNRGTCKSCGTPVVGFLALAPFVKFALISGDKYQSADVLPETAHHIFYHSRVCDANDQLPKIEGYFASEWAVSKLFMRTAFKK
jgi:hypothetical protein